ncbi:MAG: tetratricopeptide repeat protein [Planctomycetes bacterium]|nr:tetratricopeptide repeat protein [Planctomycetota bacterium]
MPTVAQLEDLLAESPDDPFLLYGIAQAYAKADRHEVAIRFYDRCLAIDPQYCYAYYHKAKSLDSLERQAEATGVLEAGIEQARALDDAHAEAELTTLLEDYQ